MSLQVQIQKGLRNIDFLTSSIYERNDLTGFISPGEKFMVRQGDLIVTNYHIDQYRKRGLREALIFSGGNLHIFAISHIILPEGDQTLLVHPEHGVIVIPRPMNRLHFYNIDNAVD